MLHQIKFVNITMLTISNIISLNYNYKILGLKRVFADKPPLIWDEEASEKSLLFEINYTKELSMSLNKSRVLIKPSTKA